MRSHFRCVAYQRRLYAESSFACRRFGLSPDMDDFGLGDPSGVFALVSRPSNSASKESNPEDAADTDESRDVGVRLRRRLRLRLRFRLRLWSRLRLRVRLRRRPRPRLWSLSRSGWYRSIDRRWSSTLRNSVGRRSGLPGRDLRPCGTYESRERECRPRDPLQLASKELRDLCLFTGRSPGVSSSG